MSETISFSSDYDDEPTPAPLEAESTPTPEPASSETLDPTGALPDQVAAKEAANALGDQDAVNLAGPNYAAGADVPTAQNVRRNPELFDQETIDSFNVDLPEQPHEAALREAAEAAEAAEAEGNE